MEDRRVFARIEVKLPLKFVDPLSNKTAEGQAINVSASGIGFVTKEDIPEVVPIEIWLDIPDHHGALYARGTIVWRKTNKRQGQKQRLGVCLEKEELLGLARVLWAKGQTD